MSVSARAPSSLLPPMPRSPPMYPDLYGKRREAARLHMLDREIVLLQEDLKFVEGLQPASAYCKEVVDFVLAADDPLTPSNKRDRKSCRVWKWLCKLPCFNLPRLCCCHCSLSFQVPRCCGSRKPCDCTLPKCDDNYCSSCFHRSSCSSDCCRFACPSSSCFHSLCTEWSCHVPKCAPWVCCYRCKCVNKCCNPCYSCCCL